MFPPLYYEASLAYLILSISCDSPILMNMVFGDDSRRTIRTRIGSLQVTATTLPRPAKYRPVSVTATILPRVIIHLLEGPFFENVSIDEVSIPATMAGASKLLRSKIMSQLPLYRQAPNMLIDICTS